MDTAGVVNAKLEALRKKEAALREAITLEKVRQQKRQAKEAARVHAILGQALALHAMKFADFRLMLKQVLQSSELQESDRAFLTKKGWL